MILTSTKFYSSTLKVSTFLSKKIIFSSLCYLLLAYSILHYIKTGIFFSFREERLVLGDMSAAWPTYWAWKINPSFILQNSSVVRWMGDSSSKHWQYGPMLHYILFPFLFFNSYKIASYTWLIFCHMFLLVSMFLWYKMLFIDKKHHSFSVLCIYLALWFNFFPLYEALCTRNIEIVELLFLSSTFYFLLKKKDGVSGIFLGMAVMTKFLPLIFIPYFLLKRKFRLITYALITLIVIGVSAEFSLGWKNSHTFAQFDWTGASNMTFYESQSIPTWINRLFAESPTHANMTSFYGAKIENAPMTRFVVKTILLLILIFYAIVFFFSRKKLISIFEIALIFILMIALPQHNHIYYLCFLLIPFSISLYYYIVSKFDQDFIKKDVFIFIFSYFLIGIIVPVSLLTALFSVYSLSFISIYQFYSIPVYGYLLLLAWLTAKQITSKDLFSFENNNIKS